MTSSTSRRSTFTRATYTQLGWTVLAVGTRRLSGAALDHQASIGPAAARGNFALATGARSGVWALVVNGPEGARALLALEAKYGPLPPTPTVQVGHERALLFEFSSGETFGCTDDSLGRALDVRGEGGWLLLPPSLVEHGRQVSWKDSPATRALAPTPIWLLLLADTELDTAAWEKAPIAQLPPWVPGERQLAVRRLAGRHRQA